MTPEEAHVMPDEPSDAREIEKPARGPASNTQPGAGK